MLRTTIYVDGFNLYYRALRGTPYKWLNLKALCVDLLGPQNTIDHIKYFTARVSGRQDPDEPKRQHAYLRALESLPELEIFYGNFITKTKWRPLVLCGGKTGKFVHVHDTEEKGSDVNLAAHLINDGWKNLYDVAVVISQDTDLIEPLRMVREEIGKPVGLVWADGKRANGRLSAAASFVRHITPPRLAAAQFPSTIPTWNGKSIRKPDSW